MLLKEKVAIITGAGSGIGRSGAMRFAAEGAAVLLADVRGDKAKKVADLVTAAGGRAVPCETNVGDAAQVEAMIAAAIGELGRLGAGDGVTEHEHFLGLAEADQCREQRHAAIPCDCLLYTSRCV